MLQLDPSCMSRYLGRDYVRELWRVGQLIAFTVKRLRYQSPLLCPYYTGLDALMNVFSFGPKDGSPLSYVKPDNVGFAINHHLVR